MTFLIWRLHRVHAIVSAVVIVAVTALIVPTGIAIANSYHHAVMNCSVNHVRCGDIAGTVFGHNGVFTSLVQNLAMAFPLVLGILWGAPLVAREFEAGTEDFAWTQGVTRRRWVLTNLGWALLVAAAWGGALAALFTWWRGPDNAVDGLVKFIYFDLQGVAPIAYAVFAMALGIAAGALFRRVVPAITTTLVVFLAVRIVTALVLRPQFAVSKNVHPSRAPRHSPGASAPTSSRAVRRARPVRMPGAGSGAWRAWRRTAPPEHITYLPASRF
jgi:ABC-type transport system involved in multi-copper enzyme maturation permease subunit